MVILPKIWSLDTPQDLEPDAPGLDNIYDLAKLLHRARQAGWLCDDYRVTRADGVPHYVLLLFNLSVPMLVLSPYPGCTSSPQLPYLALDVLAGLIGRAPRVAMYSTGVFCNDNPLSLFRSIFHCFIPLKAPVLARVTANNCFMDTPLPF